MKKSHIIGGLVVLGSALTFVVYINKKSPEAKEAQGVVAEQGSQGQGEPVPAHFDHNAFANRPDASAPQGDAAALEEKSAKIDAYIASARLKEEFGFLDEQMDAQYQRLKTFAQADEIAMFEELRSQLTGDALLAKYKQALQERFSETELDQLNALNKDPAYIQFKEAQAYGRTQQGMKEQMEFARTWKESDESPERLAELKQLVKTTNEGSQMERLLSPMEKIFSDDSTPKGDPKQMASYKKMMQDSINEAMLRSYAASLKGKSVEEIRGARLVASNDLIQRAADIKIDVTAQSMVDVLEPALKKAMAGN